MKGLSLHCGSHKATIENVIAVPTPPPTDSWVPIPHARLIQMLVERIEQHGLTIKQSEHGLWRDGSRYFGLFQTSYGDNGEFDAMFGLRNAHDKSLRSGLAMGCVVFICDNLSFSGEIMIGRKHTTFIERDLPALFDGAFQQMNGLYLHQNQRIAAYKETDITNTEAHDIVCEAVVKEALMPTKVKDVLTQWHTPNHREFAEGKNGWRLFNAFTEALKGTDLNKLPSRTQVIHTLMDAHCGLAV